MGPVYLVRGCTITDEVRFNQLHNLTDDALGLWARIPAGSRMGVFEDVAPSNITGSFRGPGAVTRATIGSLICRYGPWGCAVATRDGRVVHGVNYALTCAVMGIPCRVCRVPYYALRWLDRSYGSFSFAHLAGDMWRQSSCQRPRLRHDRKRVGYSSLYETHVLPHLGQKERLLDFGAGKADYARMLEAKGHNVAWIEFFPTNDGTVIDGEAARAWCRTALAE